MATGKGNKYLTIIVVIAIIVIILAIVIPMYRSGQVHKHLNTALDGASSAKLVVEEAATVRGGDLSLLKADELHWNKQATSNPYVADIHVLDGGRVRVTTRNTGSRPDPVFMLTPTQEHDSATIDWQCSVVQGSTSALPDDCPAAATADKTPAENASVPAPVASTDQPG